MTYNPLDSILTLKVPPRPSPRIIPNAGRQTKVKILLLTASIYDLRRKLGPDWAGALSCGHVMEEQRTFRSKRQALTTSRKISEGNLVVYCHEDRAMHPFVIGVGITKGCYVDGMTVYARWKLLSACTDWEHPLESGRFGWTQEGNDDAMEQLRKKMCKSQWFEPVSKFWNTYESLIRSGGDVQTNTAAKRLVIFVELAFQRSSESLDVWEGARSV